MKVSQLVFTSEGFHTWAPLAWLTCDLCSNIALPVPLRARLFAFLATISEGLALNLEYAQEASGGEHQDLRICVTKGPGKSLQGKFGKQCLA